MMYPEDYDWRLYPYKNRREQFWMRDVPLVLSGLIYLILILSYLFGWPRR